MAHMMKSHTAPRWQLREGRSHALWGCLGMGAPSTARGRALAVSFQVKRRKAGTRRAASEEETAPVLEAPYATSPRPVTVWRRLRCGRSFTPGCGAPAACGGSVRCEPPGASSRGLCSAGFCADALRQRLCLDAGDGPVTSLRRAAFLQGDFFWKHRRSRSVTSLSHRVRTFDLDWPSCGTMRGLYASAGAVGLGNVYPRIL